MAFLLAGVSLNGKLAKTGTGIKVIVVFDYAVSYV